MVFLTRRERFNAAHRLFKPGLTDAQNYEIFGKCSNPNWHGHNYVLYVTVKGEPDTETGFAVNLNTLSKIINKVIIEPADHKNLNLEVYFMKGRMTTAENIAISVWEALEPHIIESGVALHCVEIQETENNKALYYGPVYRNER